MAPSKHPPADDHKSIRSGSGILTSAVVGAVVSIVASFVPFSPILGGGVAAYFQNGDSNESIRVGALSGIIAAVPLVVIVTIVFGFLSIVPLVEGHPSGSVFFGVLLVFVAGMALVYTVALSALGGFVGHELLDRQERRRRTRSDVARRQSGPRNQGDRGPAESERTRDGPDRTTDGDEGEGSESDRRS